MNLNCSDPATMGLRERKRLETRQRIEDEATRLFLDRSFDGVTLEEVCEAADISRRTFFNYFSSKEHVAVGKQPPLLTEDDFSALRNFAPDQGSLPQFLYDMLANKRLEEARKEDSANLDPELAEAIRWRRSQILERFPSLALTKLANYEKLRSDLATAVCQNFENHPSNRGTELELREEAHLIVTAVTTVQWAAATSAARNGQSLTRSQDFDVTLTGLRKIFSAIQPSEAGQKSNPHSAHAAHTAPTNATTTNPAHTDATTTNPAPTNAETSTTDTSATNPARTSNEDTTQKEHRK